MKPLLLGEAPSRTGDRYWRFPLSGAVARTLCTMAEIPPMEGESRYGRWTWALYERFECRNLFDRYVEATPWSAPAARTRWLSVFEEDDPVLLVCLGRRVQASLHQPALDFHDWGWTEHGMPFVTIPHPSGLNRLLNSEEERERCGQTLREALAFV